MGNYERIKNFLKVLKINKIGGNLLSIANIAKHYKVDQDLVATIVEELIAEEYLRFRNGTVNKNHRFYYTEYLQVINKRFIIRKN